jgi:hypothetical protein
MHGDLIMIIHQLLGLLRVPGGRRRAGACL